MNGAHPPSPIPLKSALGIGARTGSIIGIVFAGFTLIGYLVAGAARFEARFGGLFLNLVAHVVGGTLTGLIAGALIRLVTSKPRAMIVGVVAFIPYFGLFACIQAQHRGLGWGWQYLFATIVGASLMGAVSAHYSWDELLSDADEGGG